MKASRGSVLMFMFVFMAGVLFTCYSLIVEDFRPSSSKTYSTVTYNPVVIPEPESSYSLEIVTTTGERTFENVVEENKGYVDYHLFGGGNAVIRGTSQYEIANRLENDEDVVSYRFTDNNLSWRDSDYFEKVEKANFKKDKTDNRW